MEPYQNLSPTCLTPSSSQDKNATFLLWRMNLLSVNFTWLEGKDMQKSHCSVMTGYVKFINKQNYKTV